MKEIRFTTPEYTTAKDIKRVRKQLRLTQKQFAMLLNCSQSTIERWENSEEPIAGHLVLLLKMLEKYPNYIDEMMVPQKVCPLRLWYMHENNVCTLIDVDELQKQVIIKNYTDNVMFRAFGAIENPNYEQYQEFLKTRCFPESRDKLKLVLKDLGLPFYDPMLIIEKTEGRMAEDNFWIRIER